MCLEKRQPVEVVSKNEELVHSGQKCTKLLGPLVARTMRLKGRDPQALLRGGRRDLWRDALRTWQVLQNCQFFAKMIPSFFPQSKPGVEVISKHFKKLQRVIHRVTPGRFQYLRREESLPPGTRVGRSVRFGLCRGGQQKPFCSAAPGHIRRQANHQKKKKMASWFKHFLIVQHTIGF